MSAFVDFLWPKNRPALGEGLIGVKKGMPRNLEPRWLGHAQLATTAISADAAGEEERHIAARLWT